VLVFAPCPAGLAGVRASEVDPGKRLCHQEDGEYHEECAHRSALHGATRRFTMNGAEQITPPVLIVNARSGGSLKLLGAASVACISGDRLELMDDALSPQFVCDQPDDGEADEGDALA
jgi:hypothetical protein